MTIYTIYALRRGSGKDDKSYPVDIADNYIQAADTACDNIKMMRTTGYIISKVSNFILMEDEVAGFTFSELKEVA